MPRRRKLVSSQPSQESGKGLFRTTLAGPGQSLNDVFSKLERANVIENVTRHRGRDLFGARVQLAEQEGEGYWDFARIRDQMYVVVGRFSYKDPRVETLAGDGLIQFCFNLTGDLTLALSRSKPLRLAQPSLLVYHHPPGVDLVEWTEPRASERLVAINIQPAALLDIFGEDPGAIPTQLSALHDAGSSGEIPYIQVPLTAAMYDLATKMVENPYSGPLALVYIEALAQELMCVALANIGRVSDEPSEHYSEREVRSLHAARAILMRELSHPPTIPQVARAAGINETTLKRGFKALFGETIFEFSIRCRMQQALKLFREQRLSVAEVGEAVGYRHQTSFATAFRRHFGLRPKDVRRRRST